MRSVAGVSATTARLTQFDIHLFIEQIGEMQLLCWMVRVRAGSSLVIVGDSATNIDDDERFPFDTVVLKCVLIWKHW